MAFALLNRIFGRADAREAWRPLYAAIVAEARAPHWYRDGGVADEIDGRFEMICLIGSLVMLRMETFGQDAASGMALLTEVLVEDMEGQVREIGFGDLVVGKQVGQMMGALGGRLGAYRLGLAGGDLTGALLRNVFRGEETATEAKAHVEAAVRTRSAALGGCSLGDLKAGRIGA